MSNLTGQDLVDRLSDLLLADVRDNLELAFEITKFEMPSGATVDVGDYFTFDSSTTQYYVYYEKDGSTGNDPAPGGRTGIKVDILEADTSGDVATKTVSAVDIGSSELTSITNSVNIITLISDSHTNITQLADNNVGLTDITVTDPKGQFDPNHLSNVNIPDGYDKILSKSIAKKSIIEAINKIILDAKVLENTVSNNLTKQFGVIGDFVSDPSKKTDLELIAGDLLLAVAKIYKELHGSDLNAPDRVGSVFPITSSDLGIDAGLDMNSTSITELASGGAVGSSAANIDDTNSRKTKTKKHVITEAEETQGYIDAVTTLSIPSINRDTATIYIDGGVLQHSDVIFPLDYDYSVGSSTSRIYINGNATVDVNDVSGGTDANLTNLVQPAPDGEQLVENDVIVLLYTEK